MLVNKIILQDEIDSAFSDLIIFDDLMSLEKITEIINEVKMKYPNDYTFDDILKAIKKNFNVITEIDLYSTEIVKY